MSVHMTEAYAPPAFRLNGVTVHGNAVAVAQPVHDGVVEHHIKVVHVYRPRLTGERCVVGVEEERPA